MFCFYYSVHLYQPACPIVRFWAHIRCRCLINTPLHYTTRECIAGSMRGRTSILSRVRVAVLGRSPGRPAVGCWLSPDPSSTVVRPCDVRLCNAVHRHISSGFSIESHTLFVIYDLTMMFTNTSRLVFLSNHIHCL